MIGFWNKDALSSKSTGTGRITRTNRRFLFTRWYNCWAARTRPTLRRYSIHRHQCGLFPLNQVSTSFQANVFGLREENTSIHWTEPNQTICTVGFPPIAVAPDARTKVIEELRRFYESGTCRPVTNRTTPSRANPTLLEPETWLWRVNFSCCPLNWEREAPTQVSPTDTDAPSEFQSAVFHDATVVKK